MSMLTRRDFLKATTAAAALAGTSSELLLPGEARATEKLAGITWGGVTGQTVKKVSGMFSEVEVDWAYYATASGELLGKTKAAWPNAPFDLSQNWDPEFMQMQAEGWLETVTEADIPNLAQIPRTLMRFRDANDRIYAIPIQFQGSYLGYRKDLVQKPIREMADLLDPSLKGKVCLPSALKGLGMTIVVFAVANGGSEKNMEPGWEFMKKLARSGNVGRVGTSEADIQNSLNTGETAICYWNSTLWNLVKKNWPCEILSRSESPTIKTILNANGYVIFKGPRADLAKKVVNFMLTPEANEMYNALTGGVPVNPKSKVPEAAGDFAMNDEEIRKYVYFPDFSVMAKEHEGWVRRWEQEIVPLLKG